MLIESSYWCLLEAPPIFLRHCSLFQQDELQYLQKLQFYCHEIAAWKQMLGGGSSLRAVPKSVAHGLWCWGQPWGSIISTPMSLTPSSAFAFRLAWELMWRAHAAQVFAGVGALRWPMVLPRGCSWPRACLRENIPCLATPGFQEPAEIPQKYMKVNAVHPLDLCKSFTRFLEPQLSTENTGASLQMKQEELLQAFSH